MRTGGMSGNFWLKSGLILALALGLASCAGADQRLDSVKNDRAKSAAQASASAVPSSPVIAAPSQPASSGDLVVDPAIGAVAQSCAYIIEIYEEYRSAPVQGVEREVTACLNQMALASM